MSLYYCPTGATEAVLASVAAELQFGDAETIIHNGSSAYVWRDWDAARFGPAEDPQTGVMVLLSGRIALPRSEWSRAEDLPFKGGLAARVLLEKYLSGGVEAIVPFNGSAIVLIEDARSRTVTVWTDQFGYHPCFLYRTTNPAETVVTTFPDLILCDQAKDHALDLLSMAEFVRGWRAVPPHSYFERIKHAGAATRVTIQLNTGETTATEYWRPFEQEFYPDIDTAADALAAAVDVAIKERTDFAERPVFMISGGADSRVLLFATENRAKVTGVNLYERLAEETAVAKELCDLAGINFVALQRDRDFYPRLLPEITRWSGGMWSAEDSHYLGFADEIGEIEPDLLMTACTTDWLFKGYGLEKDHIRLFGKKLPFYKFRNVREEGFLPNSPSPFPDKLEEELRARHDAWFAACPDKLETPRDFLMVEDRRIRPACYAVSVSGQIMARTFPYDTFLADSRVAECYSRIKPSWKLNRQVWGKVAARICSDAGKVVDSNYGWAVDASMAQRAFRFAIGWFQRRVERGGQGALAMTGQEDRAPSAGSWPEYGWYAHNSPSLAALWSNASPEHQERMRIVLGEDPWESPLSTLGADGHRLMRLSTMLAYWTQVEDRKERAMTGPSQPV